MKTAVTAAVAAVQATVVAESSAAAVLVAAADDGDYDVNYADDDVQHLKQLLSLPTSSLLSSSRFALRNCRTTKVN